VKTIRKTVSGLLGFDRRERRGTYVLSILLIILIIIRVIVFRPGKGDSFLSVDDAFGAVSDTVHETGPPALFSFDPNSVSHDDLLRLGLTGRQATTLINYRNSGARFRRPEDIRRVYGIDSLTAMRLIPYITIELMDLEVKPAHEEKQTVTSVERSLSGHETALLDINLCNAWELEQLPGIGPVLSVRIIRYRRLLGGFVSKSQLNEVYGLDTSVVRLISERVTLTFDSVAPLVLDSASFGDLARHPYLGYETARVITRYRTLTGVPLTLGAMVRDRVITAEQAERISPYVMPSPYATGDDYEFISSKVLK
jgi:competence protein ComEA